MATLTKGKTFLSGEVVTPQKLHELVDLGNVINIVNSDLSSAAGITDDKLAQISTSGKVANSATTATNANTINAIVARDGSGNFSAGTITAALAGNANTATTAASCTGNAATATTAASCTGNAATATKLATARTINGVPFDGTANISFSTGVTGTVAISQGGTGATTAADARTNLGAAASSHTHDLATPSVNGFMSSADKSKLDGIPSGGGGITGTVAISQGGTGATTAAGALTNLGAAASSHAHDASAITTGTLPNARTTADFTNTPGAIVLRDGGGGFRAGQIISSSSIEAQNLKAIVDITIYPDGTGSKFFLAKPGNITVFKDDTTVDSSILTLGCTFASNSGTNFINFNRNYSFIGSITQSGTSSIAYNTSSDYRLKTNLEPLTAAVSRLLQIPVHRFNWLADPTAPKVDGFLAHEAQVIVPESVTGHKDEVDAEGKPIHQGIDQSKLVPLLVAAVQELAARVAALEAR